jgi:hypothetical protein
MFWLYSDENKIRSINENAFSGLNKLIFLRLHGNRCIDEDFEGENEIETLKSSIQEICTIKQISKSDFQRTMHYGRTLWFGSNN